MFLIDDILLAPVHGIFWIFREIRNAAQQEQDGESESITAELTDLYMMLETGKITEAEFDASERVLLDRLDAVRGSGDAVDESGEDESGEDESGEDEGGEDEGGENEGGEDEGGDQDAEDESAHE